MKTKNIIIGTFLVLGVILLLISNVNAISNNPNVIILHSKVTTSPNLFSSKVIQLFFPFNQLLSYYKDLTSFYSNPRINNNSKVVLIDDQGTKTKDYSGLIDSPKNSSVKLINEPSKNPKLGFIRKTSKENNPLIIQQTPSISNLDINDIDFNITECTVINKSGTYTLNNDIRRVSGYSDCIEISKANDVTLDCNNHSIDGSLPDGFTVSAISLLGGSWTPWGLKNITIRNCILKNGAIGIDMDIVNNSLIEDITFINNYNDISIFFSSNNTIKDSYFYGKIGMEMGYTACFGSEAPRPITEKNLIYNNYFNNSRLNIAYTIFDAGTCSGVQYNTEVFQNYWNITSVNSTNIIGKTPIAGNYWAKSDRTGFSENCTDSAREGLCDEPYIINISQVINADYMPLTISLKKSSNILVNSGWNSIIFNILPEDKSLSNVLSSINGNYSQIKTQDKDGTIHLWDETLPDFANDLTEINYNQTYMINMKTGGVITVVGYPE